MKGYARGITWNHSRTLMCSCGMYTGQLVPLLGATSVIMECGEKQDVLQVLVVEGDGPNILG